MDRKDDERCNDSYDEVLCQAEIAREASIKLALLPSEDKDGALLAIASLIEENFESIILENKKDLDASEGLEESMRKRLKLDTEKISLIVKGLRDLSKLEDPVGKTLESLELQKGLTLFKVSCPIGVVASIFESRPDALVQIFSLCFKSGNSCILKGGSEALNTNRILYKLITSVTEKIVPGAVIFLESRDAAANMLKLDRYIDLIIPRGSKKLVRFVMDNTKIPVLGHSDGICHAYVDYSADLVMAEKLCLDAKVQYPAACNSIETLLVHKNIAERFLPLICASYKDKGVEMRGDERARKIFKMDPASSNDWDTEYGSLVISIKIVDSTDDAISHINLHGSKHSEMIVTSDESCAKKFIESVDASSVMWNCSTRFADGYRYGKGAETGISTGKIHARGPVGLEGLIIYKYILKGSGNTVGEGAKFTHKRTDDTWQ